MTDDRATVLVIEDDEADQLILRRAAAEGFSYAKLEIVSSGIQALAYVDGLSELHSRKSPPDLIFLDLNMPGMDGLTTLSELRLRRQTKLTPIVILTTSSAMVDAVRGYAAGANTFMTKPSSFEELVRKLKIIDAYWFDVATLPKLDSAA